MTIGQKLKYLIEEHLGITIYEFAKRVGFERADAFYKFTKGETVPSLKTLNKIFNAYPEYKLWLLNDAATVEELKHYIRVVDPDSVNGVTPSKKVTDEVSEVPEGDYMMMVQFEDLETAAGKLGGGDLSVLPQPKKRLVPREYEKGYYLVVRVHGHSMDDGSKRSISDGEELLIKEFLDTYLNLPIRNKIFVIVTKNEGSVVKQIVNVDKENELIVCHSFNPQWDDYTIGFEDILQVFTVEKKVKSNIIF